MFKNFGNTELNRRYGNLDEGSCSMQAYRAAMSNPKIGLVGLMMMKQLEVTPFAGSQDVFLTLVECGLPPRLASAIAKTTDDLEIQGDALVAGSFLNERIAVTRLASILALSGASWRDYASKLFTASAGKKGWEILRPLLKNEDFSSSARVAYAIIVAGCALAVLNTEPNDGVPVGYINSVAPVSPSYRFWTGG